MWTYEGAGSRAHVRARRGAGDRHVLVGHRPVAVPERAVHRRPRPRGSVIGANTLAEMWRPQYDTTVDGVRYGLGSPCRSWMPPARRPQRLGLRVRHRACRAARGRLGVVVVCTLDGTGPVATRIADTALRLMLAHRAGRHWPAGAAGPGIGGDRAASKGGITPERAASTWSTRTASCTRVRRAGASDWPSASRRTTRSSPTTPRFGDRVLPLGYADHRPRHAVARRGTGAAGYQRTVDRTDRRVRVELQRAQHPGARRPADGARRLVPGVPADESGPTRTRSGVGPLRGEHVSFIRDANVAPGPRS